MIKYFHKQVNSWLCRDVWLYTLSEGSEKIVDLNKETGWVFSVKRLYNLLTKDER